MTYFLLWDTHFAVAEKGIIPGPRQVVIKKIKGQVLEVLRGKRWPWVAHYTLILLVSSLALGTLGWFHKYLERSRGREKKEKVEKTNTSEETTWAYHPTAGNMLRSVSVFIDHESTFLQYISLLVLHVQAFIFWCTIPFSVDEMCDSCTLREITK